MWLKSEVANLNALFAKVNNPKIQAVLGTDDLASIENLNSTEVEGLRNYLFEPKVKFIFYSSFDLSLSIKWKSKLYDSLD